jgi:ceramide glucosyltransferase
VFVTVILFGLTLFSSVVLVWQFVEAWRFPLHRRVSDESFAPAITILKPLKGFDMHTAECLRSWMTQKYSGPVQILFAVQEQDDPVCHIVRALLSEYPDQDAELVHTAEVLGPNIKVSNLVQLARRAKHGILCVSDADVRVPEDFLVQAVSPLRQPEVGLVNCFYQLANAETLAMRWEAIAVNADFWSQVLQSNTLQPQAFALGAVMMARRAQIEQIGGFESLLDHLADDYQLGHKIARTGARIELSPVVVECVDSAMSFTAVWKHQLRWARTIRASRPGPYFFSILSNAQLWSALLALFGNIGAFPLVRDSVFYGGSVSQRMQHLLTSVHVPWVLVIFLAVLVLRVTMAGELQRRLTRSRDALRYWWMVPAKDFLGAAVWAVSFLGGTVEWRGRKFRLGSGGRLKPL